MSISVFGKNTRVMSKYIREEVAQYVESSRGKIFNFIQIVIQTVVVLIVAVPLLFLLLPLLLCLLHLPFKILIIKYT